MNRAIFLDRDGVLNQLAFNPRNGEYESPHALEDLEVFESDIVRLKALADRFQFFIVSNQPSFAKGKTSMEATQSIAAKVSSVFKQLDLKLVEAFYCYHHPEAIVPELRQDCECRKPGSLFLRQAADWHGIELKRSWMIGDQDTDIQCGDSVGCRTVLIENPRSQPKRKGREATLKAANLTQAISLILQVET